MTTRPCPAAPRLDGGTLDLGRGATVPRTSENELPASSDERLHTVFVTFEATTHDRKAMVETLYQNLTDFHIVHARDCEGRMVLALTVEAHDVWFAVRLAMNAVTSTGYLPVAVTGKPTPVHEEATSRRRLGGY